MGSQRVHAAELTQALQSTAAAPLVLHMGLNPACSYLGKPMPCSHPLASLAPASLYSLLVGMLPVQLQLPRCCSALLISSGSSSSCSCSFCVALGEEETTGVWLLPQQMGLWLQLPATFHPFDYLQLAANHTGQAE